MTEAPQTVLIVDDEPNNIAILANDLKDRCRILMAKNGEAAIKRAMGNQVDLILLDIMMPGMDGLEVCRQLKNQNQTQDVPIIFLTAMDEMEDEERGLNLGAVDYIKKPFSLPIVRARVNTHLELKRKTDMLERLASLDGLTGVSNRRRFEMELEKEWKRSARVKKPLAVLLLDIDHFKLYNDHYGHLGGDECLKSLATQLESSIRRPTDMLARYGGEEFVAILPETDLSGAREVAANMLQNVAAMKIPHEPSPTSEFVSLSIGAASVIPTEQSANPHTLVRAADEMLYKAKGSGRNQVCSGLVDDG